MKLDSNWRAVLGDDEQATDGLIQATRFQGYDMYSENVFEVTGANGVSWPTAIIAMIHPNAGPMRCSLLMSKPAASCQPWREQMAFPLMVGGTPNRLRIMSVLPNPDRITGMIETQAADGVCIRFTEPMFWGNFNEYQVGADCVCSLSGLALELKRIPAGSAMAGAMTTPANLKTSDQCEYGQGESSALSPSVEVPKTECRTTIGSLMRCRSRIATAESFEFAGVMMYRLLVACSASPVSNPIWFQLYASECVLADYKPAIGDEIEAEVTMQGYLSSLPPIDVPPIYGDPFSYEEDAVEAFAYAMNTDDIEGLSREVIENVLYESPSLGTFRAGRDQVIAYLRETMSDLASKRLAPYVEMGQVVIGESARPCALVAFNNPNQATGVILFDMTGSKIQRVLVQWGTAQEVAKVTRRLGRYPQ